MNRIHNFSEFNQMNEGLSKKDNEQSINEGRRLSNAQIDAFEDEEVDEIPSRHDFSRRFHLKKSGNKIDVNPRGEYHLVDKDDDQEKERIDVTGKLTDEDVEGVKEIDSPDEFIKRYQLKDGRIIDVTPSGKYLEVVTESVVNEKLDGEELLSAKQKKLPEALKKGIIAKLKKQKPAKDEDCDDKEDKECKDDDKEDKDDKKKSGSDEEKYLTPKQRKLPEGLKKGIIARAKKSGK